MVDIDSEDFVDHDEIVPEQLRMARTFTAMEVDHDTGKGIRSAKGISDGRASMKEEKKNLKREKKKLAKKIMKKKMLAEFSQSQTCCHQKHFRKAGEELLLISRLLQINVFYIFELRFLTKKTTLWRLRSCLRSSFSTIMAETLSVGVCGPRFASKPNTSIASSRV